MILGQCENCVTSIFSKYSGDKVKIRITLLILCEYPYRQNVYFKFYIDSVSVRGKKYEINYSIFYLQAIFYLNPKEYFN